MNNKHLVGFTVLFALGWIILIGGVNLYCNKYTTNFNHVLNNALTFTKDYGQSTVICKERHWYYETVYHIYIKSLNQYDEKDVIYVAVGRE